MYLTTTGTIPAIAVLFIIDLHTISIIDIETTETNADTDVVNGEWFGQEEKLVL